MELLHTPPLGTTLLILRIHHDRSVLTTMTAPSRRPAQKLFFGKPSEAKPTISTRSNRADPFEYAWQNRRTHQFTYAYNGRPANRWAALFMIALHEQPMFVQRTLTVLAPITVVLFIVDRVGNALVKPQRSTRAREA